MLELIPALTEAIQQDTALSGLFPQVYSFVPEQTTPPHLSCVITHSFAKGRHTLGQAQIKLVHRALGQMERVTWMNGLSQLLSKPLIHGSFIYVIKAEAPTCTYGPDGITQEVIWPCQVRIYQSTANERIFS
jgi:hypothetical protein